MSASSLPRLASRASHASKPPEAPANPAAFGEVVHFRVRGLDRVRQPAEQGSDSGGSVKSPVIRLSLVVLPGLESRALQS
eukprot:927645-Pleurochrysis_carterae.AAC.1